MSNLPGRARDDFTGKTDPHAGLTGFTQSWSAKLSEASDWHPRSILGSWQRHTALVSIQLCTPASLLTMPRVSPPSNPEALVTGAAALLSAPLPAAPSLTGQLTWLFLVTELTQKVKSQKAEMEKGKSRRAPLGQCSALPEALG